MKNLLTAKTRLQRLKLDTRNALERAEVQPINDRTALRLSNFRGYGQRVLPLY